LVNDGNGNYRYLDNLNIAEITFVKDLPPTLWATALDGKIQVDLTPDVAAYFRPIVPIRPGQIRKPGCLPTVIVL
jgi:hypothetical protein